MGIRTHSKSLQKMFTGNKSLQKINVSLCNSQKGRIGCEQFRIVITNMLQVAMETENLGEADGRLSRGSSCVPAPIQAVAVVQGESCGCSPVMQPSARGGNPPLCPGTTTQTLLQRVSIYSQPSQFHFCLDQVKLTLTTPREFLAGFENALI